MTDIILELIKSPYILERGLFAALFIAYLVWNEINHRHRDQEYTAFLQSIIPIMQQVADKLECNSAITLRVEKKVNGCAHRLKVEDLDSA